MPIQINQSVDILENFYTQYRWMDFSTVFCTYECTCTWHAVRQADNHSVGLTGLWSLLMYTGHQIRDSGPGHLGQIQTPLSPQGHSSCRPKICPVLSAPPRQCWLCLSPNPVVGTGQSHGSDGNMDPLCSWVGIQYVYIHTHNKPIIIITHLDKHYNIQQYTYVCMYVYAYVHIYIYFLSRLRGGSKGKLCVHKPCSTGQWYSTGHWTVFCYDYLHENKAYNMLYLTMCISAVSIVYHSLHQDITITNVCTYVCRNGTEMCSAYIHIYTGTYVHWTYVRVYIRT